MSDISSLQALLPPAWSVPVDWETVETWLGVRLPADYKTLASHGPLDIGEFVWLHVPCVQEDRFDYGSWLRATHRSCRIVAKAVPSHEPPVFWPDPGGLLALGETRSTSRLFWDTSVSADPDEWPVVVFDTDAVYQAASPWHSYGMPLAPTLAALLREGLPLPGGGTLGPLPAVAARTAYLTDAQPWTPPPTPRADPEADARRRAALTEGSGLDALRTLLPPPPEPYLGDADWEWVYEQLGTRLPAEYVTLMETYGGGELLHWLRLSPPLDTGRYGLVGEQWYRDAYRELRADFPEYQPLPVWPEKGGFLPFASTIDGDQICWLTEGEDPDAWPLIVIPRHADQGGPLPMGLTGTLLEWLRGRFRWEGFPGYDADDDPLDFIGFDPYSPDSAETQEG
ncbi:SMI1/KNR4 family protein [Streptomyces sp. ISL-10]|uniref:SMI1/KNR4 family protein n=1 Tax=Streptomyces sp. ISL-10 TaxID=2819172 RepID=UPI001BE96F3F|nr:SMI1/KNR4 family protein [Streptomyces sp. ISL-10]MBT2367760.1 SMI1/KNR4 family protein [Streptomyces sp. ISL-10]